MWSKHPAVERALGHGHSQRSEDGVFWMSKEDFGERGASIYLCFLE